MKRWQIVALAIVGVFALSCGGCVLLVYQFFTSEVEQIRTEARYPQKVSQGETFEIELDIHNDASYTQSLHSLDIYDSYRNGITIQSSDPPYNSTDHILNFQTYSYGLDIPANDSITIVLSAEARQTGRHLGDLDVCINNAYTFVTEVLQTTVEQ